MFVYHVKKYVCITILLFFPQKMVVSLLLCTVIHDFHINIKKRIIREEVIN